MSDEALNLVTRECPNLETLAIMGCMSTHLGNVSNSGSTSGSRDNSKFPRRLLSLDARACKHLIDVSIQDFAQQCHQLQTLNIGWCRQLTDDAVLAVVEGCPKLQSLSVAACVKLTDKSIMAVGRSCPELRELVIAKCLRLSDASLATVVRRCPLLQKLDVSRCRLFTDSGLMMIPDSMTRLQAVAKNCVNLEVVDVSGCIEVTMDAVNDAAKMFPGIDIQT
eukprot:gene3776-4723_t